MTLDKSRGVDIGKILTESEWLEISSRLHLSARESQIVRLMLCSLLQSSIAKRLRISPHTVHTHVDRVYRKVRVSGRCELVLKVLETHVELTRRAPPNRRAHSGMEAVGAKRRVHASRCSADMR